MADRSSRPDRRYAFFGGPLDTGNLGVSALGVSVVHALATRAPGAAITIFDHGRGARPLAVAGAATVVRRGAWWSRRVYRPESLHTMELASRIAPFANANVRELRRTTAVLDISGGDSFSDIYGRKRFDQVVAPKRLALRLGRPLVLLPQTYGPFRGAAEREVAARIVGSAAQAWARDAASFERLAELVGDGFDPIRHRQGVDVAFALPREDPGPRLRGIASWLDDDRPTVGVNVSGLLNNDAGAARERFGLQASHPAAIRELITRWLHAGVKVLLVPHVRGESAESDDAAAAALMAELGHPDPLRSLPTGMDASQTKWLVGQLDWFAGARMHATIAALSTEVPVAGIAYSDKMRGVFASCGLDDAVHDLRTLATGEMIDALWASWEDRDVTRRRLRSAVPAIIERAEAQFDHILEPATRSAVAP